LGYLDFATLGDTFDVRMFFIHEQLDVCDACNALLGKKDTSTELPRIFNEYNVRQMSDMQGCSISNVVANQM